MKVTSTRKVLLSQDRDGAVEEFIQIQIKQTQKNDDLKEYIFETKDFMVLEKGTENEILSPVINRYGDKQTKPYHKTYEEYDGERTQLLEMFPSELTGSELYDYLLLCALKYSLTINPIYGLSGDDWE